jgi:hypothetical protein
VYVEPAVEGRQRSRWGPLSLALGARRSNLG